MIDDRFLTSPQWITSSRLLKLGEVIEFQFYLPSGMESGDLRIYPRYLEQAEPGRAFSASGSPGWLEGLNCERVPLRFAGRRASARYKPKAPGSYLARWSAGGEWFHRYFAAIEDDWTVLRFSTFEGLEAEPTLHATGIPLDYRLPMDRFREADPLFQKFLGYHRHYGDTIIPAFPDTPDITVEERVRLYGKGLEQVRALMPDPSNARSARLEMRHDLDPGYTETFMRLGVNDHCGLNEANAKPWLGMPEFPYFSSRVDCRKANQEEGGSVVAHQWDFCGGWHFLGPVSWHYKAAEGDWALTKKCLNEGLAELQNLAVMSGHPAFAVPLYDGVVGPGYPNPSFHYQVGEPRNFRGAVAQVFIVGRALSQKEILRVMGVGATSLTEALAVWPLDEEQGRAVHDASGHSRHGDLVGGPRWVQGMSGAALNFDGDDDSVVMRQPVTVDTVDFSLGCWVKPGASQRSWANLLSSHNNDVGQGYRGLSLEQDGDRVNRFYLIAGNGDRWVGPPVVTQLRAGVWQHFAVVRHGPKLTHYLNGEVTAEGDVPGNAFPVATDYFRIGNWARGDADPGHARSMLRFVERYQRFMAFEVPKKHRVVYARSIDISDYYRKHFRLTPRTVFVSKTDHLLYDRWWLCNWCNDNVLVPRERIPWDTRTSSVFRLRETLHPFKDPLSCEYLLVEDHKRSLRFERECANPIWWFDYTHQERGPKGSAIAWVRTPDVDVRRSPWTSNEQGWTTTLTMLTGAELQDYALCLWGLPKEACPEHSRIETNAKEFVLARNTDGEYHLVLFFHLRPNAELRVTIRSPRR